MESKRKSEQEGGERGIGAVQIPVRDSKRRREEDSQESDTQRTIGSKYLHHLTTDDGVPNIAKLIREWVREEFDRQVSSSSGSVGRTIVNQVGTSGSKFFELVFKKELPAKIYTYSKIEGVEIALYDTRSNSIVTDGPLSSMKIEICALYGDFDSEDWSTDAFNANIVRPRENKGRLLKGETVIRLENGVVHLPYLAVTDNTCWLRCRKLRLGAKVSRSDLNDSIHIREGRSNSFIVLDASRGEANLKNRAPSLNDEICCLRHIPKNGRIHDRLLSFKITTVKDLLQEHEANPSSLQKKFGNISKKYREEIIEHAKEAKHAETTCVAEAAFEGKSYHSEKKTVNSDEREAHKKLKDPMPIEKITQEPMKTLTEAMQYGALDPDLQQKLGCFPIAQLQEEISRQTVLPNWSAGGQYGPGTAYTEESQIDQINASYFSPDIYPLLFPFGDGAEPSNNIHSSFPNPKP